MLTRYLLGLLAVLLGLSVLALKVEESRLSKAKKTNVTLQQNYDNLNKEYTLSKALQGINYTEDVKYQDAVTQSTVKEKDILSKVDQTTKQVKNHEITSVAADVQYSHSMWDAYCQAAHEASHDCPAQ